MEAGKWDKPGNKSESMEDAEGQWSKPGKKSDSMKSNENKFSYLGKKSDGNPSKGNVDEWSRPGEGKEGSGNHELGQRPQPGSNDGRQAGAARWGDPEIHENSEESEILCDSSERLQSLEGIGFGAEKSARAKRAEFNAGAFPVELKEQAKLDEEFRLSFNVENEAD